MRATLSQMDGADGESIQEEILAWAWPARSGLGGYAGRRRQRLDKANEQPAVTSAAALVAGVAAFGKNQTAVASTEGAAAGQD